MSLFRLAVFSLCCVFFTGATFADPASYFAVLKASKTLPYVPATEGAAVVKQVQDRLFYLIDLPAGRSYPYGATCEVSAGEQKFSFPVVGQMGRAPLGEADSFDHGSTGFLGNVIAPAWLEWALGEGNVTVRIYNANEDWNGTLDQTTNLNPVTVPTPASRRTLAIYTGTSARRFSTATETDKIQALKVFWVVAIDPAAATDAADMTASVWKIVIGRAGAHPIVEVSEAPSDLAFMAINGSVYVTDRKGSVFSNVETLSAKGRLNRGAGAWAAYPLPATLAGVSQTWTRTWSATLPDGKRGCIQDSFTLRLSEAASLAAISRHETAEDTINALLAAPLRAGAR